jgi:hypothetical protein
MNDYIQHIIDNGERTVIEFAIAHNGTELPIKTEYKLNGEIVLEEIFYNKPHDSPEWGSVGDIKRTWTQEEGFKTIEL